jgi:outer membrane protein OmpA-like peptidoglycan-associated protein
MQKLFHVVFLALFILLIASAAPAQTGKIGGGVGIGTTYGETSLVDKLPGLHGRAFVRYGLTDFLTGEFGLGAGYIRGELYRTELAPVDLRLVVAPVTTYGLTPFMYAGAGLLNYKVTEIPVNAPDNAATNGWTGYIPVGIGLQVTLNDRFAFEASAGYNRSFTDNLKAMELDRKDAWWNSLFGISTTLFEDVNADADGDGLTNKEEAQLGTDPHNPDTDGDGLTDGAEVNQYHSSPLKTDSDGDGLSDYDEVMKYHTDPNKADSDGDGLNDGDEVLKYHTDPLKTDTDGDGLNDGDEVLKYHSDPLRVDTDGGTISDGKEVQNGTNPLDPADDIPKPKEVFTSEVGKAIVLEGVVFETNKSTLKPESEEILTKAFNTLNQNPEISVEIRGYTDNTGSRPKNMKLSQARAESVRAFLVAKGVSADRITAKGYGPENPVAPNTTKEGKQKNRRIEFLRTK